jgi:UDP-N-acetylmuramoyl-tripeptide--D-alanyl-D-alanine ligase
MTLWRTGRRLRFFLHILQLEGYKPAAFVASVNHHASDTFARPSHAVGGILLVASVVWPEPLVLLPLWGLAFASSRRYRRDRPKKPFVPTARMKRLVAGAALVDLVFAAAAALIAPGDTLSAGLLALFTADLLAPAAVYAAAFLLAPVERAVHRSFIRQAKAHLGQRPDLQIVAITGSYGKTSVKFAIRDILGQRFPVLATPGSFNTPMGICRVVNTMLADDHRWLVLEMGIRHKGDIAELCDIARPHIAVITSIGVAHLETMGSVDAIAEEKGSLLRYVQTGGRAVLNLDDPRVAALAGPANAHLRPLTVSARGNPEADIRAEEVAYSAEGVSFTVVAQAGNAPVRVPFTARLLGEHNILNILLAIGVGQLAGLTVRQMRHAVARMQPVPHRLELRHENGQQVLDDAFNSNPVGARSAIDVLSRFTGGKRVVITPGMVELGGREADENRDWGRYMADKVDDVVLVGPERTRPIAEGLRAGGFPEDRIHPVRTLCDAREWLARHTGPGDTILYENDLPDQYTEAAP